MVPAKLSSASKVRADEAEPDPEKVHITERQVEERKAGAQAVADEAEKGYDLLFIGLESARKKGGSFSTSVTELAHGFEGNLAIAAHDGKLDDLGPGSRILIAVNGTEAARRAAEIAFAAARGTGSRTTAIYVSRSNVKAATRRHEEEVLKDIARLAERYGVDVATRIAGRKPAAEMILKEGNRGKYDLIVLGVSARPGEDLFLGNTATQILADWEKSVLLLVFRPEERHMARRRSAAS